MTKLETLRDIMGHRIEGDGRQSADGRYTFFTATKSAQTMSKFVSRAEKAGIRCYINGTTLKVHTIDLED